MKKYYCKNNRKSIMEKLNKYGVAIIPNLLNQEEITSMNNGMWDYLEHLTQNFDIPIKRNDNKTWNSFYKLYPLHSMLVQHWSIAHAQYIWDIRQNQKVVDVFANIWNTTRENLLVSFDGASYHFPPEVTKRGTFKNNYWFHSDQSFTRPNFECVQSWVTGYDVNDGDATLCVIESSHLYNKDFKTQFNIEEKSDWYKLNEEEIKFYLDEKKCKISRITCPAGSIVLWDSRTIHCGTEPLKTRNQMNFRNVAYICMMPRSLANDKSIEKKQKAFNDMRVTTHWANKTKLFAKYPRTYGQPLPNITHINQPVLSELGLKLAGF